MGSMEPACVGELRYRRFCIWEHDKEGRTWKKFLKLGAVLMKRPKDAKWPWLYCERAKCHIVNGEVELRPTKSWWGVCGDYEIGLFVGRCLFPLCPNTPSLYISVIEEETPNEVE